MPTRTSPQTIVVVGASRGIGLSLCRQLAARGDRVIATARGAAPDLAALPVEVVDDVDITSAASVAGFSQRIGDRPIDVLVVVAGILQRVDLEKLDFDRIRQQFEVNAVGPLRVAAALRDRLHNGSKVLFLTSRMGSIDDNTSGGHYGYRMSKAALNMAARSLARDLDGRGVAVGLLHPGFVRTEMTGGRGDVTADTAASMLIERIDEFSMAKSGSFMHANGQPLPW
jgi:NAD(P)-dependent dehydrogenase (short-subunit alcohol dehydrogenase family)